jgi:hypothetical protein
MTHAESCTCRQHPLPASLSVQAARDLYLAENGFTVAEYSARWTSATFLGIPLLVLNTKTHAWGIMLHDLHHLATGYGTDLRGEGEISVWEARGKLASLGLYTGSIVLTGVTFGWLLSPSRMKAASRAPQKRNLFDRSLHYDSLLAMTVGELRGLLGIPEAGVFRGTRELHARAPDCA